MSETDVLIAIVGGFVAGVINTLAGNGSAITLTILTELLGLPPTVANGTNRVGVFTQTAASSYAFYQGDKLSLQTHWRDSLSIILGAIVGVWIAVNVSNAQFKQFFSYMMIAMLVVLLVRPKRWLQAADKSRRPSNWLLLPMFFLLGLYGGFIQMGMGVFFLALTVLLARYELIEANALKSFVIAIYTILVLFIFHSRGLIDWKFGGIIAIGQTLGGYLTAHFASTYPTANVWAHRLLVVVVIWAILKLFGVF